MTMGTFINGIAVCECGFRYPSAPQDKWTAEEAKGVSEHQMYHLRQQNPDYAVKD